MRLALLCSVLAIGCGGAPFTMLPASDDAGPDDADDAGTLVVNVGDSVADPPPPKHDAGVPETGAPETSHVPDAAPELDASPEAEAASPEPEPEAGVHEAAPTCTPLGSENFAPAYCPTSCGTGGCNARLPSYTPIISTATCSNSAIATPSTCMCKETFTCACLMAESLVSCPSGGPATCTDRAGYAPTIVCP